MQKKTWLRTICATSLVMFATCPNSIYAKEVEPKLLGETYLVDAPYFKGLEDEPASGPALLEDEEGFDDEEPVDIEDDNGFSIQQPADVEEGNGFGNQQPADVEELNGFGIQQPVDFKDDDNFDKQELDDDNEDNAFGEQELDEEKNFSEIEIEFVNLANEVLSSPVSSEANRAFNELDELYDEYSEIFSSDDIVKYEFVDASGPSSPYFEEYHLDEIQYLNELYFEAQEHADMLFEESYSIMCRLVNAEAGGCDAEEQYRVANVVENRVKSNRYPNTLNGVIYQRGQYAPTRNGAINKIPSEYVKANVEDFLRGRVETGMPDNVVYQSKHRQGHVWMRSRWHYYCY